MAYDYDLFVIGAGSGGVRAARIAASLGAKVGIAENLYLGGTCVNVGCVPKKLFVYASEFRAQREAALAFGWQQAEPEFQWPTLRDNTRAEVERLNGIYGRLLDGAGVSLHYGLASFVDAHTVDVAGQQITAEKILIATGGWPRRPSFPGAEHVLTSNEVFGLDTLPKKVLVQGGGYIAVEFAGIFNGLGVDTTLVYRKQLFLRGFDTEVREFVAEQVQQQGLTLRFNDDIASIDKNDDGSLEVSFVSGRRECFDAVFSAIGRSAKTSALNLSAAGVELDERGFIRVDDTFKTNVDSIYAVGDVIGRVQLTPVALAEGMALAKHWYAGEALAVDYSNIATAVFCQPNIATVGLTEDEARAQGLDFDVYASNFKPLKHTVSGLQECMLMKLLVDKQSDAILGAHVVGEAAGEMIQSVAVAMKAGASKAHFDQTIGIHPTAAEELVTMREPRA
ncbi:glutathione-disulfide reductase [Agaribacterium haliotis]|uniref:glutathione-disulfide reductase n=1 Tax=Agaribacterium haliotis TaxID=2013869 RepID=UPI000BB59C50|nr:glutathione-disulfide reductase [Agaribacterium haliotis]